MNRENISLELFGIENLTSTNRIPDNKSEENSVVQEIFWDSYEIPLENSCVNRGGKSGFRYVHENMLMSIR